MAVSVSEGSEFIGMLEISSVTLHVGNNDRLAAFRISDLISSPQYRKYTLNRNVRNQLLVVTMISLKDELTCRTTVN